MNYPLFIGGILLLILMLLWVYKCIGVIKEGRHKNIYSFGRWSRTIAGSRDAKADKDNGELKVIPAGDPRNKRRFFFILYPIEKASSFEFPFSAVKLVAQLTNEEKQHVEWGDLNKDNEVVVTRIEKTDHHRDQYDYDMIFKDIETGLPQLPSTIDASKIRSPQNVKVKIRLRITVKAVNPQDAENRTGGGTLIWFPSLKAVIHTGLGDLIGSGSFSDLIKLRGENLDVKKLSSGDNPEFLVYVNKQMLEVKKLGYKVLSMDFIDYEIMPESKPYMDALAALAKSEVDKETADNKAYATERRLAPFVDKAKELIKQYQDTIIAIKKQEDVTMTASTKNLTQLKVLGSIGNPSGTQGQGAPEMPDLKTIISILTAQMAKEEIEKP